MLLQIKNGSINMKYEMSQSQLLNVTGIVHVAGNINIMFMKKWRIPCESIYYGKVVDVRNVQ